MPKTGDYSAKFESFKAQTLYGKLSGEQQAFIRDIAVAHRLTFQELRRAAEVYRDLSMWGEGELAEWWARERRQTQLDGPELKKHLLRRLEAHVEKLTATPARYPENGLPRPAERQKSVIRTEKPAKKRHGMCPVASPKTVCCQLRTIDAAEGCPLGCSYCAIQTFYRAEIVIDDDLGAKLMAIPVDPARLVHFGSGQSSDSLVFGNRNGMLDALLGFARQRPNVILELKTKSDNVGYLLEIDVPPNVVCSWSLNTPTVIRNEEHFTASLEQRLRAARSVADKGVKLAFHFHPLVCYQGWETEYPAVAAEVMERFSATEVAFVSFGSLTLIKPAIRKIRELGHPTKVLQAKLVPDPHGRLTYPDDLKVRMFQTMLRSFDAWRDKVYIYLCMEKRGIWQETFGWVYPTNDDFESDFCRKVMAKLSPRRPSETPK
jgi:spore photoproduct lyase